MSSAVPLSSDLGPDWLRPLLGNLNEVRDAYRSRVPAEMLASITAAGTVATVTGTRRDAAVLILFSGPEFTPADSVVPGLPDDADLLVTVRASTLRHHAGEGGLPGVVVQSRRPVCGLGQHPQLPREVVRGDGQLPAADPLQR